MKVYLDMDGVCADFFTEAVKLSETNHKAWRDMEFRDVELVLKRIRKGDVPDFFERLPMFPGTQTLVQCIYNIAGGFSILSSPLEGMDDCERQKRVWIEKNLRIDPDEIIITSDKTKFASENCRPNILIDDYGANIRAWEEAGGYGIKYQADEMHMNEALIPLMALYKGQR